jgi:hypothetical protein
MYVRKVSSKLAIETPTFTGAAKAKDDASSSVDAANPSFFI